MPDIFKSKKFQAAVVGVLVVVLREYIPGLEGIDVTAVLAPIVAYILGQGVADLGKEAAKIKQQ